MKTDKSIRVESGYAFYDLDFTLLPHDSCILLCNYILKRYRMRTLYLLLFFPFIPFALIGLIHSDNLKRIFLSFLWKLSETELDELSRSFVKNEIIPLIYPELKETIIAHKNQGRFTILNTASPEFYVKYIADELGFDAVRATGIEINDTVAIMPRYIGKNNKNQIKLISMMDLLPEKFQSRIKENPGFWDSNESLEYRIPNSHAYSDSPADLPMLRLAENATLVHPISKKFIKEAEFKGWDIIHPPRPYRNKFILLLSIIRQMMGFY